MSSEVIVVRIYLHETEHGRRTTLQEEILTLLHDQHRVKGVTVFRGIAGFGASGMVHAADLLRLTVDLPVVIEFYDRPEVAEAAMELLNGLVPEGHMIWWHANCRTLGNGHPEAPA
jgi:PII-like signaling protein